MHRTGGDDLRAGCCGFPMARAEYYRRFSLVEVQQTFYHPPRIETLRRWKGDAPRGLEFTLKAWQLITHEPSSPTYRRLRAPVEPERRDRYGSFRPTDEVAEAWKTTLQAARTLEATVIVFQCPASFTPDQEHIDNLRTFFGMARSECGNIRLGWEPRGNWPRELAESLCRELGLTLVVDPFTTPPLPGDVHYFRLHGIGGYRHRYTDEELERLLEWRTGTTYYLFNNMSMAEDAQRLIKLAGCQLPRNMK